MIVALRESLGRWRHGSRWCRGIICPGADGLHMLCLEGSEAVAGRLMPSHPVERIRRVVSVDWSAIATSTNPGD